jgi:hypothetical protein
MVHKDEVYKFLCCNFYVYDLYKWAEKHLTEDDVKLSDLANNYGFDRVENSNSIGLFHLDKEYAMTLCQDDLEQPLLFVNLGEECGCLLIDGTHRAFNLWKSGKTHAKAYMVTDDSMILKNSSLTRKMLNGLRKG